MDALAQYYSTRHSSRIGSISKIQVSSPPCKKCAFVMNLLGVIGLVEAPGPTCTMPPGGSWAWPDVLKNPVLFQSDLWTNLDSFCKRKDKNYTADEIAKDIYEAVHSA